MSKDIQRQCHQLTLYLISSTSSSYNPSSPNGPCPWRICEFKAAQVQSCTFILSTPFNHTYIKSYLNKCVLFVSIVVHCHPSPCINGGTCSKYGSILKCSCSEGYIGMYCEVTRKVSMCYTLSCDLLITLYAYEICLISYRIMCSLSYLSPAQYIVVFQILVLCLH